jgi:hypothetical protein
LIARKRLCNSEEDLILIWPAYLLSNEFI